MTNPAGTPPDLQIKYGFGRVLNLSFEKALDRVRDALKAEGFGVLCEIDVQEKLKEKLGVEFRKYKILGACNPPLAYQALQEEIGLGLLLPCNVVVYEMDDLTVVAAIDAAKMLSVVENAKLERSASMVNEKLQAVIKSL
jgi:uncharacterized protein (DUF302 family)